MEKMKFYFKTTLLALTLSVVAVSCTKKEDDKTDNNTNTSDVVELKGTYTTDLTLDASKKYLLKGFVYIQAPAKLTIPAGTIIKGDKETKGTLIIERGAKIFANGEANKPIVFTSNQPKGQRSAGDWGGVVILGKAKENQPGSPITEGGTDRPYGGDDDADNSGVFKYVRIEFAGIALVPNSEINGLTLGAVGSGTEIHHVQVSYCGDDSFEWFGGTVNCKYLISYKALDDDFDTDFGYNGTVQYAVALRDPKIADISGSNGFESDNDANGSEFTPFTAPVFANVSLFGPYASLNPVTSDVSTNHARALHLRRNTYLSTYNSVFAGFKDGLYVDGTAMNDNVESATMKFSNNIIAGTLGGDSLSVKDADLTKVTTWWANGKNKFYANSDDLKITDPFKLTGTPNFLPKTGSPLLSGGYATLSSVRAVLENTTYIGAFNTTDWTAGWANWDPQNTDY